LIHQVNAYEKEIEALEGILDSLLSYIPTEDERELWVEETENLKAKVITEKEGLQLLYKRIKDRANTKNATFGSRENETI
jgi:hypothetical protein